MNFINTEALARCIHQVDALKPFQRLSSRLETVKTVCSPDRFLHRAKASVLMRHSEEVVQKLLAEPAGG